MCSGSIEVREISGSAKGAGGWFPLEKVQVSYDHPFMAQVDEAVLVDMVNSKLGPGARIAMELSPRAAKELIAMIEEALREGQSQHAGESIR